MKKTTILLASLGLILLAACSGGSFKKTRSGLMYKIISDKQGKPVQRGQILKLQVEQRLKGTNKDTVLATNFGKMPDYGPVDSVGPVYNPAEIFPLLRKGDSAIVIMEIDTLLKKNPMAQLPPFMNRKDKFVINIKVVDVFAADSLANKDRMAEMTKEQARQEAEQKKADAEAEKLKGPATKEMEDYLAKNKIVTQKTPGGTYVEIKDPGTGLQASEGKKLSVKYTGKIFPTGKVFESNMDGKNPPIDVVLGTHGVIPGWEEGLTYFKKGGKGTLYIPFFQAYGSRPGPDGKPNQSLVFDVEVVDVTEAQAPPAAGQTPPPPPADQNPAGKKK